MTNMKESLEEYTKEELHDTIHGLVEDIASEFNSCSCPLVFCNMVYRTSLGWVEEK